MSNQPKLITGFIEDFKALVRQHDIMLDMYAHEGEEVFYVFKARQDDSCVKLEELVHPIFHGDPKRNPN